MIKKIHTLRDKWATLSNGAQIALLLTSLAALVLLTVTAQYWGPVLLLTAIAATLLLGWWKGQQFANIERYRSEAANFLYWFLAKNYRINEQVFRQEETSIPLKHIHDATEIKRFTAVNLRKSVAQVEIQLTLGHTPTERDLANCDNFLEWLRTDAHSHDAECNRAGWAGFPYLYPTAVFISGQHLHVQFVVVNNPFAVHYLRDQPGAQTTEIDFHDADYTKPPLFDAEAAERGKVARYGWDYGTYPHGLVTGSTGTGKTVSMLLLLAHAISAAPGLRVIVCDYKGGGDFAFLDGCEHFYQFDRCLEGIRCFDGLLKQRQDGEAGPPCILLFDELAAFQSSLDKKQAEEVRKIVGNLLMLGRSFGLHMLVGLQRPDAEFLRGRDNLTFLLALGNLSAEAKQMVCPDSDLRGRIEPVSGKGAGHLILDGAALHRVQAAIIPSVEPLHDVIRSACG